MSGKQTVGSGEPVGRVLIVDGHDRDRKTLAAALTAAGFAVNAASGAAEARRLLKTESTDAIVVDPALGDEDGLALIRALSDEGQKVFVVAKTRDESLAEQAYASGAIDFACKPILTGEWPARLRHAIVNGSGNGSGGRDVHARLTLNRQERSCTFDGRIHALTRHERDFLACLLDSPNHFATYEKLIAAVWGDDKAVETQYLRVLVAQVRRKLEQGGQAPLIHTIVGEGLKLSL